MSGQASPSVIRVLESYGYSPERAAELAGRISEEVSTWPPLTGPQRKRLAVLLDLSEPLGDEA